MVEGDEVVVNDPAMVVIMMNCTATHTGELTYQTTPVQCVTIQPTATLQRLHSIIAKVEEISSVEVTTDATRGGRAKNTTKIHYK